VYSRFPGIYGDTMTHKKRSMRAVLVIFVAKAAIFIPSTLAPQAQGFSCPTRGNPQIFWDWSYSINGAETQWAFPAPSSRAFSALRACAQCLGPFDNNDQKHCQYVDSLFLLLSCLSLNFACARIDIGWMMAGGFPQH